MLKKAKKFNKNMTVDDIKAWYRENDANFRFKSDKFNMLSGISKSTEDLLDDELGPLEDEFEAMALAKDKLRLRTEGRGF